MIKAIIFDFDGVIVESANIKTEAFKELFSKYPQNIERIISYHLEHAGVSRYVKFRYIYSKILGQKLSKVEEIELGKCFSQIVLQKVLSAPFVAGAKEFLDRQKNKYLFFIASGTPEEELHRIMDVKKLQGYFKESHGSPKNKRHIIKDIAERYNLFQDEVIYVGDAESDRISAQEAGITYVERKEDQDLRPDNCPWTIRDLFDLNKILKGIEKSSLKERLK